MILVILPTIVWLLLSWCALLWQGWLLPFVSQCLARCVDCFMHANSVCKAYHTHNVLATKSLTNTGWRHNSHSAFTSIKVVLYWFRFLGDEAVDRVLYHLHGGRYGT